jgi:small-conductance mechanosensitive channel
VTPDLATGVQASFGTPESRFPASGVVLALLALAAAAIWRLDEVLEAWLSTDDVEAVQAVAFSIAASVTGWFLVVVWRAADEVASSLEVIRFGPRQGVLALVGLLTLIVAYTLTRVSKGLLDQRGGDVITAHRREILHHFIQIAVYVFAFAFVLSLAGVNPGDLLVGAGAIGLVVGLAARQTLGGILAGFVLIFARQFEVGDWVVIGEQEGIVTDITLFNTQLRTYDDEHVLIPNDEVTQSEVVNRSQSGRLRVSVDIGVDYDADVGHAAETAEQAVADCDVAPLLSEPSPTVVGKRFGDSAVVLECRFWISDPSAPRMWQTQTAVIREIKAAFAAEDIKIPFPQRELMGREEATGLRLTGDAFGEGDRASMSADGHGGPDRGGDPDGPAGTETEGDADG